MALKKDRYPREKTKVIKENDELRNEILVVLAWLAKTQRGDNSRIDSAIDDCLGIS